MKKSKGINKPIITEGLIEVPLNSLLLYIVDGMIPLVTTFCKRLVSHNSSGLISEEYPTLLTPRGEAVLKSVGDSIAVSICSIILSGVSQYVRMHLELH